MWICLNSAFLSVIADKSNPENLLVRASRDGDIEAAFKGFEDVVKVEKTPGRDYLFRASLPREVVSVAMAAQLRSITYGNFKDSVRDPALHDAYFSIWHVMADLQPIKPYSKAPRAGFKKHPVR